MFEKFFSKSKLTPLNGSENIAQKDLGDIVEQVITDSYDDITEIITAKIELAKLDIMEVFAALAAGLAIASVGLIGAFYLLTSLALFLGELFNSRSLGFLAVGTVMMLGAGVLIRVYPDFLKSFFLKVILSEYEQKSRYVGNGDASKSA
jgi:hypothetical protein